MDSDLSTKTSLKTIYEKDKNKTEIKAYGLRVLLSTHKEIKNLKKKFKPSNHGNKVWSSSWLLIDYIKQTSLIHRHRVIDIGCGWGLTGIYCSQKYGALVTGADIDLEVQPYLKLLAKINKVNIDFLNLGFDDIKSDLLRKVDVIIGSDICFCDTLIDSLRRLIIRAKKSSVGLILIGDPGRWPFDDLTEFFIRKRGTELLEWNIRRPSCISGKILKITN